MFVSFNSSTMDATSQTGTANPSEDFKHPMIFWQNVAESCTFQKRYGVEKVKLHTKWSGRLEKKPTYLVENLKEMNLCFLHLKIGYLLSQYKLDIA